MHVGLARDCWQPDAPSLLQPMLMRHCRAQWQMDVPQAKHTAHSLSQSIRARLHAEDVLLRRLLIDVVVQRAAQAVLRLLRRLARPRPSVAAARVALGLHKLRRLKLAICVGKLANNESALRKEPHLMPRQRQILQPV
jgi:hypothetical protein